VPVCGASLKFLDRRTVFNAKQNQWPIERNRDKRAGCHANRFAVDLLVHLFLLIDWLSGKYTYMEYLVLMYLHVDHGLL
jgi:hypothetical protein